MADFATPSLPSRDFDAIEAFYAQLGFTRLFRADYWLILTRGEAWLEFSPGPISIRRKAASAAVSGSMTWRRW